MAGARMMASKVKLDDDCCEALRLSQLRAKAGQLRQQRCRDTPSDPGVTAALHETIVLHDKPRRRHIDPQSFERRHAQELERNSSVFRRRRGEASEYLDTAHRMRAMTPSLPSHKRLSSLADTLPRGPRQAGVSGES